MVKRQPPNEYHQTLPLYEGVYKPKQNIIDFESAREVLMKEDYKIVMERHFERIYNIKECKSYMKNEINIKKIIYLKIKRYLFMDSTMLKPRKSRFVF